MQRAIIAASLTLALTACAPQPQLVRQTASGYAEAAFRNTTIEEAKSKLIAMCATRQALIEEVSLNMVTCTKPAEGMNGVMTQVLLGNSYSTPPEYKLRLTVWQEGADVRVMANQWVETMMPGGQVNKAEVNSNLARNNMQKFLSDAGAS